MIRIERAMKIFGKTIAVNDLNLQIEKGLFFGFLGQNGAGKTTTIKMMTGLLRPTKGRILIDGMDVQENPVQVKRKIGYVPDNPYIYEKLTGREFLRFIGGLFEMDESKQEERIDWLLNMFQMQSMADRRTEEYSHGMRQKIVMSSAILHEPDIIIVDEPMVGLDPQSGRLVKDILKKLSQRGTTIFMSSHSLSVVEELCDRIGIIKEGKLIALGSLEELSQLAKSHHETLEELFLELTGGHIDAVLI
ncbi:MAG: ABC transporter [Candidatus Cloacimonetes bacterium 4572_55]|nr:MAG: ABC transporter [Candidatus Cloacimonetes bacterium 4572_55]